MVQTSGVDEAGHVWISFEFVAYPTNAPCLFQPLELDVWGNGWSYRGRTAESEACENVTIKSGRIYLIHNGQRVTRGQQCIAAAKDGINIRLAEGSAYAEHGRGWSQSIAGTTCQVNR